MTKFLHGRGYKENDMMCKYLKNNLAINIGTFLTIRGKNRIIIQRRRHIKKCALLMFSHVNVKQAHDTKQDFSE